MLDTTCIKRVFIAGTSRTGSMWTYNVTRSLLKAAGGIVVPEVIPVDENGIIQEALASDIGGETVYCIKTHKRLRNDISACRIITNYRDVRDSMMSFIKFMHLNTLGDVFKTAKQVARAQMAKTDFYFTQHKDNLRIRYDDMIADPVMVIHQINEYLGLGVEVSQIQCIQEQFSRENVSKILASLKQVLVSGQGVIEGDGKEAEYETVENLDGSFRVFDKKTAFQTNHISSKKEGEWREFFTLKQQAELNDLVGDWLKKYGFPV